MFGWLKHLKPIGAAAAKVGAPIAIEVVKSRVPFGGLLTEVVTSAIQKAAAQKDLPGAAKKNVVLDEIDKAGPLIIEALEKSGMRVRDGAKFTQGAENLVEAWLDLLKATDALPEPGDFQDVSARVQEKIAADGSREIRILVPSDAPAKAE